MQISHDDTKIVLKYLRAKFTLNQGSQSFIGQDYKVNNRESHQNFIDRVKFPPVVVKLLLCVFLGAVIKFTSKNCSINATRKY